MVELITAVLLAYVSFHGVHVGVGVGFKAAHKAPVYQCRPSLAKALALPKASRSHLDPALFCRKE